MLQSIIDEYFEIVAEMDRLIGGRSDVSHFQGCLYDFSLLLLVNVILWAISLFVGKCWPADLIWSNWPGVMCSAILYRSPLREITSKQYLLCALVWFWGARLTLNFFTRWHGVQHEDWRYSQLRSVVGKQVFPLVSLLAVFLGQSAFLFSACLPLYAALRNRFSQMNEMDLVGVAIMLLGIVIETYADEHIDLKKKEEVLVTSGLWTWSRHPNYFGEWLFWVGLWVFSGCEYTAIASPLVMLFMFACVSVPVMEEHQRETKPKQFQEYCYQVPSAFFPLPPAVQHLVCWRRRGDGEVLGAALN